MNIAKEAAVDDVEEAQETAVRTVQAAQSTAVSAVNSTKESAVETINERRQQIVNITTTLDVNAALALQQANIAVNEVAGIEESMQDVFDSITAMEAILSGKVDGG